MLRFFAALGARLGALQNDGYGCAIPTKATSEPERDVQKTLSLLQHAPGFFCFLRGRELVFELANAAYLKLVGGRDILGKRLQDALPELAGQGYVELLNRAFDTKQPFVGEAMQVQLRHAPDAAPVNAVVNFVYEPVLDASGVVLGILVQGYDVTDLHQRAEAGRLVEQRCRALFEAIDDGFCLMQLLFDADERPVDYRFLETNTAFERQTGLKGALGRTARELVPDLDESWFRLYGQVALTGAPVRFENHAPAMQRWFEVYATRVGEPALRQVAVLFKNITERKRAETVLQESEARFRNMADHVPVMLWVTNEAAECVYLNRAWYQFTGQAPAEALGTGWLQAVHPEDAGRAEALFVSANAERSSFQLEYRLRRHDGSFRWVIDAATPRWGADRAFLGYIGSVADITERKLAEQERESLLRLEQAGRVRAEDASRMKDEFLALISHELRTPLAAVLGWVQMLRSGTLPPDKQQQALGTIERNARSQAQLIEDLLDVSRIVSGKLRLEVEPIDVAVVVAQALEAVRPAADAKGIRLQVTLDSSSMVMGDPSRLQQVVWNLLTNAIKFTPKLGRVTLVVARHDSYVEIVVDDTGRGIAPEFLPHVFERFRQAEGTPSRRTGGLGLGLSIVQHLVEAHGGMVSVHSEGEGRGSCFSVRLPIAVTSRRDPSMPPPDPTSHQAWHCPPELDGVHVLIIDDEQDARGMLSTLLETCNARVTSVGSAEEGLDAVLRDPPALVISDIGMPVHDGFWFIQQLRTRRHPSAQLPAIALTAYARVEDRTRVLLAGFHNHVRKPVEPMELLAVIASLLSRGRPGEA